jgi:hypothetical protein
MAKRYKVRCIEDIVNSSLCVRFPLTVENSKFTENRWSPNDLDFQIWIWRVRHSRSRNHRKLAVLAASRPRKRCNLNKN